MSRVSAKNACQKKGWGKNYVGQNKLILAVSVLMSLVKRQKKHLSNNGEKTIFWIPEAPFTLTPPASVTDSGARKTTDSGNSELMHSSPEVQVRETLRTLVNLVSDYCA
jgi:hypothetical protein